MLTPCTTEKAGSFALQPVATTGNLSSGGTSQVAALLDHACPSIARSLLACQTRTSSFSLSPRAGYDDDFHTVSHVSTTRGWPRSGQYI